MSEISDYGFDTEVAKAKQAIDFGKLRIIRNILGIPTENGDLGMYLRRACELAWDLAKRETRNGEWAFAECGGFVVWASIDDKNPGKPLLHVSYRIEGWDNLD